MVVCLFDICILALNNPAEIPRKVALERGLVGLHGMVLSGLRCREDGVIPTCQGVLDRNPGTVKSGRD
jgi:hypothetical protein